METAQKLRSLNRPFEISATLFGPRSVLTS